MSTMIFSTGMLFGIDNDAIKTPLRFGELQEVSVDIDVGSKDLYGEGQFAIATANSNSKISCKAKFASFDHRLLNRLFFNQSQTTGMLLIAKNEEITVPAEAPYTVTVANAAGFDTDLGVINASTGATITKAASVTTSGYSCNAGTGVYTFGSSYAGAKLYVTYLYTTEDGSKVELANLQKGKAPTFQAVFSGGYGNRQLTLKLNAAVAKKFAFATKMEDFSIPDFEFSARADAGGKLGTLYASLATTPA